MAGSPELGRCSPRRTSYPIGGILRNDWSEENRQVTSVQIDRKGDSFLQLTTLLFFCDPNSVPCGQKFGYTGQKAADDCYVVSLYARYGQLRGEIQFLCCDD